MGKTLTRPAARSCLACLIPLFCAALPAWGGEPERPGVPVARTASVPPLTAAFAKGILTVTIARGYHFNRDAPTAAKLGERELAATVSPARIRLRLPTGAPAGTVELTTFVCDDAKTFCLRKQQSFPLPHPSAAP